MVANPSHLGSSSVPIYFMLQQLGQALPSWPLAHISTLDYTECPYWGRLFCEPASPSLEPRVSYCEPQKIPTKKSKNGHNALIWYLLHAGYFVDEYPRKIEQHLSIKLNRANQEHGIYRTLTILIPFPNSLHKRSRAVNQFVKKEKANFGQTSPIEGDPKYSGRKKPKWIFHLTSE